MRTLLRRRFFQMPASWFAGLFTSIWLAPAVVVPNESFVAEFLLSVVPMLLTLLLVVALIGRSPRWTGHASERVGPLVVPAGSAVTWTVIASSYGHGVLAASGFLLGGAISGAAWWTCAIDQKADQTKRSATDASGPSPTQRAAPTPMPGEALQSEIPGRPPG